MELLDLIIKVERRHKHIKENDKAQVFVIVDSRTAVQFLKKRSISTRWQGKCHKCWHDFNYAD